MATVSRHFTWPPLGAPTSPLHQQQQQLADNRSWGSGSFDNSVNAVSFGFVATAILISMFLVMAIFERFLRPNPPSPPTPSGRRARQFHVEPPGKLRCPSPKMSVYANGVSVLMPGEEIPTFIACPAPIPCPPERPWWPHQHHSISMPDQEHSLNTN
ncbi:hypothetical protein SAY87_022037 [Trapa incisa]|uniref:Uncharacterized protein n=1 Tax=Trapa incisa TaxID=236973 RepID=A0AAN7JUB8_9MYRT|nr:hypothetical protein SAY87_022037 [Trapa incisa]